MEDEVGGPLISRATHFLQKSSQIVLPLSNGSLLSDLAGNNILKGETESSTEANDVLKNGILIETSKGLEWLSLTEALTTGVGGLNLSVEDFQNVAAQLLHTQSVVTCESVENARNSNIPTEEDKDKDDKDLEPAPSTSAEPDKSVQCFSLVNTKLESIAEAIEHCEENKGDVFQPLLLTKGMTITLRKPGKNLFKKKSNNGTLSESSSLTVSESTGTNSDSSVHSAPLVQVKKKGGWPKGRKRKPELANRPPKAPCTGYVYYLNEKRKRLEFRNTPFPEVTKILGNEWSNLAQEQKAQYLEKAEMDKKRYREELKSYRNSEAYQSYLKRRRIKSCKTNGTEESDIDATDEIDDEDNEELYCRACDQWFTTLHNKKEHLYGKQHFQTITQNAVNSISFDESSSLDGSSLTSLRLTPNSDLPSVPDAMSSILHNVAEREREIKTLQERLNILVKKNKTILKELQELKQSQVRLQKLSCRQKEDQFKIENTICTLWDVPSYFYQQQDLEDL